MEYIIMSIATILAIGVYALMAWDFNRKQEAKAAYFMRTPSLPVDHPDYEIMLTMGKAQYWEAMAS